MWVRVPPPLLENLQICRKIINDNVRAREFPGPLCSNCAATRLGYYAFHGFRSLILHRRQNMGVGVQGSGYCAVAQKFLDYLGIDILPE